MKVKSFYSCQSTDDEVKSSDPVVLDRDTAIDVAQQVLREPRDFIGFIDEKGNTIQFYYDESGEILVEHPDSSKAGSYGKCILLSDVENVVKSLPEYFSKECISGLKFKAW